MPMGERHGVDQLPGLGCGVAGVEQDQQRLVVHGGDGPGEGAGADHGTFVEAVLAFLECDQVLRAVTGEVHDVGTEPGQRVQEDVRRRGRVEIQVDKVPMGGTLHGRANSLLFLADSQVTGGGGRQQQHPQFLRLRGPQFPHHRAHLTLRRRQAALELLLLSRGTPLRLLLFTLASLLRGRPLSLFRLRQLGRQVSYLLGELADLGAPRAGVLASFVGLVLVPLGSTLLAVDGDLAARLGGCPL
ncbi:hypothetical protein ABZ723_34165 [Streptomyces sp. NPDC006700]|uniref:hypothetical protein n=1 Tax=Streptomyces sp. NPDC006700 TaxID=3154479 RepID=UPI0033D64AC7